MIIKNKKGFTLIELIVSVMLLSGVMLFMFNLLSDLKYDESNQFFAIDNQEQRVEIINYIEKYILQNQISSIGESTGDTNLVLNSESGFLEINISPSNNMITVSNDESTRKWVLNNCTLSSESEYEEPMIKTNLIKEYTNFKLYEVSIPIYTDNDDNNSSNNNVIDDITFSFLVSKEE